MKDIVNKIVSIFQEKSLCTPKIVKIASELSEPPTTIHYNIKKMEEAGQIVSYKPIFDFKKLGRAYCAYSLITLGQTHYGSPEEIAEGLSKSDLVESIDIGADYQLILKTRTKDVDEFYAFMKQCIKDYDFAHTKTITSLKQIKSEFRTLKEINKADKKEK
jgi:DNA-binding Lrp family transcriptional regulator